MGFVLPSRDDPEAQNLCYNLRGLAGAVHAMVGLLIRRQAQRVEGAKAGFVAEERPPAHGHAARQQNFDGRIKPNHRNAGGPQEFGRSALGVGAAPRASTMDSVNSNARPSAARNWSASIWRKAGSPRRSKISGMRKPAASSMRSSRSTKRQASCRASNVPMVVLPEPMKPARQRIWGRDAGVRADVIWAIVALAGESQECFPKG